MDAIQQTAIRWANSMEVFADGCPTFNYGAWRDWQKACAEEGRLIPPAEFKEKRWADQLGAKPADA